MGEALRAIVALYTQHPALYHLQIKILLSQIWLLLCRQEGEAPEPMTPERERDEERLKRAMNYMHAHYGEHFSLEELARQALTSRQRVMPVFPPDAGDVAQGVFDAVPHPAGGNFAEEFGVQHRRGGGVYGL